MAVSCGVGGFFSLLDESVGKNIMVHTKRLTITIRVLPEAHIVLVKGRLAPSPSGVMHLGNVWAGLLAWLAARQAGGSMVLRIEDLDPARSKPEFAQRIIADFRRLGIDWDEGPDVGGPHGPYVQSARREIYQHALDRLSHECRLYPCYCTRKELLQMAQAPHVEDKGPTYPGVCRTLAEAERKERERVKPPSMRLWVDEKSAVEFTDLVAGPVSCHVASECGDFVLRRADGVHAYQLAVVVDDALMGVTHVVRGDDLLDSTPQQILLFRLLGYTPPAYGHIPLLVGEDGRRLSKRHHDTGLDVLFDAGVSPRRIIGFLAYKAGVLDRVGRVRPRDLLGEFSFERLPKGPVVVTHADMRALMST
ncbi:tRNA glutamyl-Q(34) synthetase GluQRS [Desulfovibrio inopinatus]|uniref:tRNA glutamyl-Q(34) synthetase GluQRS n=1 Tax=Desulfovibrio inopinatus TaxID=102109 RepID=UPI00040359BE|nr:tRNA glutamyl-Q(34) synthetase GluQRS [Desulfovibrio inopinatus]